MAAEQRHEDQEGNDIGSRDPQVDDLKPDQKAGSQHDAEHGGFSDGSGFRTHHHVEHIHALSRTQRGEGRRSRVSVAVKIGHDGGEGNQKKASGSQRRIHKVLSQSAEQHLHHQNGEHAADHTDPPGHAHRQIQGKKKPRYHRRKIPDGHLFFHQLFIDQFRQHRAGYGHRNNQRRADSEIPDAENGRRHKRHNHRQHDFVRGHLVPDMRIG